MKITQKQRERHIRQAIKMLAEHEATMYTQKQISEKLSAVGKQASEGLLSRIKNGGSASREYLIRISQGLELITAAELGIHYDFSIEDFVQENDPNWQPSRIVQPEPAKMPYVFHAEGRRSVQEKIRFIAGARREVIFIGLRMRQFVNYFLHRRDSEFADHIAALLARGVNVKCYLLDPASNHALFYFRDLAMVRPDEVGGEKGIVDSLRHLAQVSTRFEQKQYPGRLVVHTYRCMPTAHFLIVDGKEADGRLQVSHYLFGQPAAKVPVLELERRKMSRLYDLYLAAATTIMEGAVVDNS